MEFLHTILEIFSNLHPWHYILIVILGYFIENFFPPIPGDTFLVFSAYIFGMSYSDFPLLWLYFASLLGAVSGFMMMVFLGRHWDKTIFSRKNYKYTGDTLLAQVRRSFDRYGIWVVAGNRLFFGMRPVIGVFAGMSRYSIPKILIMNSLSAVVFNAFFLLLGYFIGEKWPLIESILQKYSLLTGILTGIVIVLIIFVRVRRRSKKSEQDLRD